MRIWGPRASILASVAGILGVNLCHLHPNFILVVAIFINFYEAYLGIYLHIHLFHYFYCLQKKGGRGSTIARGMYLNL